MNAIRELIQQMYEEKYIHIRQPIPISWGDRQTCHELFVAIFQEVDNSIVEYQHLPEYDEVIDWMTDTQGKGLMLSGDCGRGKSIILTGIVPVLLRLKRKCVHAVHSQDFKRPIPFGPDSRHRQTYLDYLLYSSFPIIDELGVEQLMNDYGEKSEGFNQIINAAERYLRPLFISTNLTNEELIARYGDRTIDRLGHLCRVIHFFGNSLR